MIFLIHFKATNIFKEDLNSYANKDFILILVLSLKTILKIRVYKISIFTFIF